MPLATSNIVTNDRWLFGRATCRIWIALDIVCCTASIVTLCLISIDRFIGVTRPLEYTLLVTRKRLLVGCSGEKFKFWVGFSRPFIIGLDVTDKQPSQFFDEHLEGDRILVNTVNFKDSMKEITTNHHIKMPTLDKHHEKFSVQFNIS